MKPQTKKLMYYGSAILAPLFVMGLFYVGSLSELQSVVEIYGSLLLLGASLVLVVLLTAFFGGHLLKMFREFYLSTLPEEKREILRLKALWENANKDLECKRDRWVSLSGRSGVDDFENRKRLAYEEYCRAMDAEEIACDNYYSAIRGEKIGKESVTRLQ